MIIRYDYGYNFDNLDFQLNSSYPTCLSLFDLLTENTNSKTSTTKITQRRAKNPTVVARNPKLSTDIPAKVGPKKLPKQNDVDHMAIEKIWYSQTWQ